MSEINLKPCPFCQGKDIELRSATYFGGHHFHVVCFGCQANGPLNIFETAATDAWNSPTRGYKP